MYEVTLTPSAFERPLRLFHTAGVDADAHPVAATTELDHAQGVRGVIDELLAALLAHMHTVFDGDRDKRAIPLGQQHVDVTKGEPLVEGVLGALGLAEDVHGRGDYRGEFPRKSGNHFLEEYFCYQAARAVTLSRAEIVTMAKDVTIPAFHKYLLGVKAKDTARKYASYATQFLTLMHSNGYQHFGDIPPGFLSEFSSMLSREGNSPSTVRVKVYAVKKYLDWVHSQGLAVEVQSKPELPRPDKRVREILQPKLLTLYFRQADLDLEEPLRTAVMLLPCSGLRASEMMSLRLGHVQQALVKLQKKDKKGKPLYKKTLFFKVLGKGNKERHVPLMEEGVEILKGYLAGWRRRQPGTWLFPLVTGKASTRGKNHVSDRSLRGAVQTLREPLGMDFTPHTMRRTYITTLWRKKIDLGTIARIAGHANVQTTIDHYLAMEPGDALSALHDAGSSLTEG